MLKLYILAIMAACPAPAVAGSTDTLPSPARVSQPRGNPITIFGNPAVIKEPQKMYPAGLRQGIPMETRKAGDPKSVKKKKKRGSVRPQEKQPSAKPLKRKLLLVSFYDDWTPYRAGCRWVLGRIFEPVYDTGTVRGLDLTWEPEPKPLRTIYRTVR